MRGFTSALDLTPFKVNTSQHGNEIHSGCIRSALKILLQCYCGSEIASKWDLFEDVLTADWILADCSRERDSERLRYIRLHVRLRLLSFCEPTSMQGSEGEHVDTHGL